jgi:UDP-N-acetylglucosamine 4,6-dehydratase
MQNKFNNYKNLRYFLGDVRDYSRLDLACREVDIIVHAAALKQVPAAEYNPTEFIQTNIDGAKNIIKAALSNKVKKTIALSTDKAAAPINLYGATKLVSDKLFIAANNYSGLEKINFSVVRYGNVLNSRGSVIPLFKDIIKTGTKVLPLTHTDCTRFLITLDEGVKFVIHSIKIMNGREIFIPKIKSFKVTSIAKSLLKSCKFKIIGLRPGEKLHEILFTEDESKNVIEFNKYYVLLPSSIIDKKNMKNKLNEKGKRLDYGFNYTSKTTSNDKYIKKLISQFK